MEKKIKETTEKLKNGTITTDEADKILLHLLGVSKRSELFFCDFCKEDNPHTIHEHKKLKECDGCGLITKI